MKIMVKNARLAFPAIFKAKAVLDSEARFSASLLLEKNDPQIQAIEKAIEEVAKAKWGDKAAATLKQLRASDRTALRDGDVKEQYDGFAGHMYISASNSTRPLVINRDTTPLAEEDGKPYAGCYVSASIELWAQDNKYGKRINASLAGVQFVKDGDAFTGGGGAASVDEFDDLSMEDDGSDLV